MMKTKIIALALAGALACPQVAFAARDGDGMEYTSAAEGFYGSLRTRYTSTDGKKDNNSKIRGSGSRLGVRGTLDVGHGLTGLYRYEFGVSGDNGANVGTTRLHYVGLKGSFGEVQAGALWGNGYNWVTSATDIATSGSGNFANHGIADFRSNNSMQYTSPNLNGFQGSFRVEMGGGSDNTSTTDVDAVKALPARAAGCVTADNPDTANVNENDADTTPMAPAIANGVRADCPNGEVYAAKREASTGAIPAHTRVNEGSNNVDEWTLSAKYGVRGFTVAGVYQVQPDMQVNKRTFAFNTSDTNAVGTPAYGTEDATFWALRGGYGQDNWAVNAWYGVHNTSDTEAQRAPALRTAAGAAAENVGVKPDDTTIFSVAGNIDVGKVGLVAIHENREGAFGDKDNATIVNVNYHFTSKSRAWVAYVAKDYETDTTVDDEIHIGLRMDF